MTREIFLKSQKILRLATIDKKGSPHLTPVWYLYSNKRFFIGTNLITIKARNLKKNNKVAFCVDEGIRAPNIYGVMGRGKANLILEKTKVKRIAKKILRRYFNSLENKSAKELLKETDCIIEIIPKQFTEWEF